MNLSRCSFRCLFSAVLFCLFVSSATYAVEREDYDEVAAENLWRAQQAGDLEKAARIKAALDAEAANRWGTPAHEQTEGDPPRIAPPTRDDAFLRPYSWGSDVTIATGAVSGGISATYDGYGNIYAVRCTTYLDNENGKVDIFKSTDGGVSWNRINGWYSNTNKYFYPVATFSTGGPKLYVFYLCSSANGYLRVARLTLDGTLEGHFNVKADLDTITYFTARASWTMDDILHVVYQKEQMGDATPNLYSIRSTDQGETWGDEVYLTGNGYHPDLASALGDGFLNPLIYLAFTKDYGVGSDIGFFRSTDGGLNWGDFEYLTVDDQDNDYPSVAALDLHPYIWVAYNHPGPSTGEEVTLIYDDNVPLYVYMVPWGGEPDLYNVRFTPLGDCQLISAQLTFWEPFTVASNGVRVYVWASDGVYPTHKIDSVDVPYANMQFYPAWTEVDFSSENIALTGLSDYHIGFTPLGDDTVGIPCDDGESDGGEHRSGVKKGGEWKTFYEVDGYDYNLFIRMVVEKTNMDLEFAYSTNSGVDWSKGHELATSQQYDEMACDLWEGRWHASTAGDMNVCYLRSRWVSPAEQYHDIYWACSDTLDPSTWNSLGNVADHYGAFGYNGREVCQGTYTSTSPGEWWSGVVYAGRSLSTNFQGLYFDGQEGTDVEHEASEEDMPRNFSLSHNYPNPFNPETRIGYYIPRACQVRLEVFNLLGQKVRTLVDEYQRAGNRYVTWDGMNEAGKQAVSGVYLYKLEAEDFTQTEKMVLIR